MLGLEARPITLNLKQARKGEAGFRTRLRGRMDREPGPTDQSRFPAGPAKHRLVLSPDPAPALAGLSGAAGLATATARPGDLRRRSSPERLAQTPLPAPFPRGRGVLARSSGCYLGRTSLQRQALIREALHSSVFCRFFRRLAPDRHIRAGRRRQALPKGRAPRRWPGRSLPGYS